MIKLNLNPKNHKTGDCVIRAIAYATQRSWDEIYKDLCDLGFKMKRMPNDKQVYTKYLDLIGWTKQKQPRKIDNTKLCIKEFIEENPRGIYIINTTHHLTVVADSQIVDTWDCKLKTVGNYWSKVDSI